MLPLPVAVAQGPRFPPPVVPAGWGVNIHFTDERPGETAKIGGPFRWVRMDFAWNGTERERGRYDFAAYDRLVASLARAKVRPYFILDYGNDLYGAGSPRTPEGRAAFCRWVAAAMAHFKGRGFVWEMWNEPNIGFWKPKPNVDEYILLARAVGQTIRRVAPKETYVGPATSGFDWTFLQRCLDAGLLKDWDAISVHPYRQNEPESVADDWLRLRTMVDRAGGRGKPLLSGEWGYSELFSGQSKGKQAQAIARAYLTNLSCGVPISIWYDWKDDGTDPKEPEHHFGTVGVDLAEKPAYAAAVRLARDLAGFAFVTRLHTADPKRWMLLFRRGKEARVAAWTTGEPSKAALPGFRFTLGPAPRIVRGPSLKPLLAWTPLPWATTSPTRLDERPGQIRATRTFDGIALAQTTRVAAERPLILTVVPKREGGLTARLENPFGRTISDGSITFPWRTPGGFVPAYGLTPATRYPVEADLDDDTGGVQVDLDRRKRDRSLFIRVPRFVPVPLGGATASAEGDAKVRAEVSTATERDGTSLRYDFDAGWRFAELRLPGAKVEGKPTELGMWVEGNGSGDLLRMRYTDATGQTFQPDGGPLDWKGWRYVAFPLDGSGGHWGGANDGVVHFPVRIGTLALVDMPGGRGGKGRITVARPVLAYPR